MIKINWEKIWQHIDNEFWMQPMNIENQKRLKLRIEQLVEAQLRGKR